MREVRAVLVTLQQVLANQILILNDLSGKHNQKLIDMSVQNSKDIVDLLAEEVQTLNEKIDHDSSTLETVSTNDKNVS